MIPFSQDRVQSLLSGGPTPNMSDKVTLFVGKGTNLHPFTMSTTTQSRFNTLSFLHTHKDLEMV